ncbi:MAG: class I mannose-6-phosphate isomerase [Verrucomicrobia bacterium]|nr:class I mannose-6-phosphate isomerase [Verrucomicrobiota bacterium]
MLYPLTFHPIYKERIWGGRNLEQLYGRVLPPGSPIGESWDISDRPEGISIIANGPLAGKSLRWLMENAGADLIDQPQAPDARFPLLVKILDASQTLSLQVHPPPPRAAELGGEPKTELWYIAQAQTGAELFVGLKRGVTREEFERRIGQGTVAECVHRVRVKPGDVMFLPSGRVHAIGGGIVIFEIQQNSDTTYRVFDWNRLDSKGRRRELHIAESLASIDFNDFEPSLVPNKFSEGQFRRRTLVSDSAFEVQECEFSVPSRVKVQNDRMLILGLVSGKLQVEQQENLVELGAGQFCLIPACIREFSLHAASPTRFLQATPGRMLASHP